MNNKPQLLVLLLTLFVCNLGFSQVNVSYRLLSPDHQYLVDRNNDVRYNDNNPFVSAAELGFYKPITDGIDIGIPIRHGVAWYPLSETNVTNVQRQSFTSLGLNALLKTNNGSLLKKDAFLSPYLTAGIEGNYYWKQQAFEFNAPVGLGLSFHLADGFNIQAQSAYHFGTTNHLMHSVGFYMELGESDAEAPKVEVETPVVAAPVDSDGDGVNDNDDKCPDVAGIAAFNGCPDIDGDGIQDADDKCPEIAGLESFNGCPDTDNDGVQDSEDACPEVAGLVKFGGCPDSDGDGIQDSKDKCPNVAAETKDGCPEVDTDGDGVVDAIDACPNKAGIAAFKGCPDTDGDGVQDSKDDCPTTKGTLNGCPDRDNDGIKDSADKCPTVAGVAKNNGCPVLKEEVKKVLEFAKQGIEFNTGSNVIKSSSYAILDNVAKIMRENPDYNLRISGYTDSQGKDATNLALSKRRAKACFDYLTKKGVTPNRMTHNGYGEASPIADNGTPAGRAKNRRVEFDIFFAGQ